MRGDNHTAYQGNSPCIDEKVEAYLISLTLPAPGATCTQDVPFEAPQPELQAKSLSSRAKVQLPQLLRGRPMRP
jgi:hypothetical protein